MPVTRERRRELLAEVEERSRGALDALDRVCSDVVEDGLGGHGEDVSALLLAFLRAHAGETLLT